MKRSSTLNLALAWAAVAAVATGLASVPAFAHHASPRIAAASVVAPASTPAPSTSAGTQHASVRPSQTAVTVRPTVTKATVTSRPTATNAPTARPETAKAVAPKVAPAKPAAPKPVAEKPAPVRTPTGTYIQIGSWFKPIVVANQSQSAINACGPAVVWSGTLPGLGSGTTWLAGHNYCGFAFWDHLSIGSTLTIHDSAGTFTYKIVSRLHLEHQGGTAVGIKHDDLMLQTCTSTGTSITYADLVS